MSPRQYATRRAIEEEADRLGLVVATHGGAWKIADPECWPDRLGRFDGSYFGLSAPAQIARARDNRACLDVLRGIRAERIRQAVLVIRRAEADDR